MILDSGSVKFRWALASGWASAGPFGGGTLSQQPQPPCAALLAQPEPSPEPLLRAPPSPSEWLRVAAYASSDVRATRRLGGPGRTAHPLAHRQRRTLSDTARSPAEAASPPAASGSSSSRC